jgi:hypothetical protein
VQLEHHEGERRADDVTRGLRQRMAALRTTLAERRVLVAGRLADSVALPKLLRYTGARLMAAKELDAALHLVERFAIDIILIADSEEDEDELALFELVVRHCEGPGAQAVFVRLPQAAPRRFGI